MADPYSAAPKGNSGYGPVWVGATLKSDEANTNTVEFGLMATYPVY